MLWSGSPYCDVEGRKGSVFAELVDATPRVVKEGVPKDEADGIMKELTEAGAEAQIS